MSEKIQTKIFEHGDPCEAKCISDYGTKDSGDFYFDRETQKFVRGFPPPRVEKFAEGPNIITDTIPEYYHPGAEKWTDSKSRLKMLDEATGSITTDKKLPGNKNYTERIKRERREDAHKSLRKAVAQVDAGTAPLNEEQRALCTRQNEIVSKALNFDAFNVVGRKNDKRGKKYPRR